MFISYRREDSVAYAARIYDLLSAEFGVRSIVMDVDTIAVGNSWVDATEKAVTNATVVVVIIGPGWLSAVDEYGRRRIDDPDDIVRIEVATALSSGKAVIPVLVRDARMPFRDELPSDIAPLVRRQAVEVTDRGFSSSAAFLVDAVGRLANGPATTPRARLTTTGEELRAVAVDFFRSAHRLVEDTVDRRLLGPEPILIVDSPGLSGQEITDIEVVARGRQRIYLVHPDRLNDATIHELDRLRTHGTAIVPLPANAMAAAITDGQARVVLSELEREYGSDRNLFETRNSVMDERFLFGRSELLTHLGGAISATESVLLTGLRKAGKTSVLNILRQHLVDYPVCHVDLQRFDRANDEWPRQLFDEMINAYDRWGRTHHSRWTATARNGDPFAEMALRREQQQRLGRSTPFVLLLDELERVLPLPGDAAAASRFARASGLIRALAQSHPGWIVVIGADLRPTANRINILPSGETNPLFQFFSEMPIRLLNSAAVENMIQSLCHTMGVWTVESRLSREVYRLSGGHPALVRMLAGASFRSRKDTRALRTGDLPVGLQALAESNLLGSFFAENFWGPMTDTEQQIVHGASAKSRRWWVPMRPTVATKVDMEAKAALIGQGLLRDDQVAIGAFAEWVRMREV